MQAGPDGRVQWHKSAPLAISTCLRLCWASSCLRGEEIIEKDRAHHRCAWKAVDVYVVGISDRGMHV